VNLPDTCRLSFDGSNYQLELGPALGIVTVAPTSPYIGEEIKQSGRIAFSGVAGTVPLAWSKGELLADALRRTLGALGLAAGFGSGAPEGWFTYLALVRMTEAASRPVVNDVHGLMVHATEPGPQFVTGFAPTIIIGTQPDRFERTLRSAVEAGVALSDSERIAFDLFTASFLENSPDARLISLVMAIETLIVLPARSSVACKHVNELIELTKQNHDLTERDRNSLLGSLRWLLSDSISSSGARLVDERLGDRTYGDWAAVGLWKKAYDIRSKLVHGSVPRPSRQDVGIVAAPLENMVGHLIAGDLAVEAV
jgi:hypothetical protein